MPLQALLKTGVELQSNAEGKFVTGDDIREDDQRDVVEMKPDVDKQDGQQDGGLDTREEEPVGNSADLGSVDNAIAEGSISRANRVEEIVRNTGVRTVRSVVNGGLALFALGALSPVGLLLRRLEDMKTEDGQDEVGARNSDSEGGKKLEDGNDL